jgi:prepilin-type N-terminal cleavage/methylation domain-containing protein
MMPLDAQRVQSLFLAAVEAGTPAARAVPLEQQCGTDAELRQRVEALGNAHAREEVAGMYPARRPGMSVIELLVVIAIVAVFIGLLLPAVQQVRNSAQRISCGNNLHQIGLGLHAYHDTYSAFPPGMRNDTSAPFPLLSWMGRLLPYVEQQALWMQTERAFSIDPLLTGNPPHVGESTPISLYRCPSSGLPAIVQLEGGTTVALGNYRGVAGTTMSAGDGMLFRDSDVRITDVKDGTSNTLMIGESMPLGNRELTLGAWYNGVGLGDGARFFGAPDVVLGVREINLSNGQGGVLGACPKGPYTFQAGKPGALCDVFRFWSQHPRGANFLAADGSLHFLTYSAETMLPILATRAGGESGIIPD